MHEDRMQPSEKKKRIFFHAVRQKSAILKESIQVLRHLRHILRGFL